MPGRPRSSRDGSSINDTDEAFFVVESSGILSQYFMAAAPHHPLMHLLVQKIIQRLYNLIQVDHQYVPRSTGPGALKHAFIAFMDDAGENFWDGGLFGNCNTKTKRQFEEVSKAAYTGWDTRIVRVAGKGSLSDLMFSEKAFTKKRTGMGL
jgi:hypothetical protein